MEGDRQILEHLEPALRAATPDETAVMIALIARESVALPDAELGASLRRALLVLAAGGDVHRELSPNDRAVTGLAGELDAPERRAALAEALRRLRLQAHELPAASAAIDALLADGELAWQALACAILLDELEGEDDT